MYLIKCCSLVANGYHFITNKEEKRKVWFSNMLNVKSTATLLLFALLTNPKLPNHTTTCHRIQDSHTSPGPWWVEFLVHVCPLFGDHTLSPHGGSSFWSMFAHCWRNNGVVWYTSLLKDFGYWHVKLRAHIRLFGAFCCCLQNSDILIEPLTPRNYWAKLGFCLIYFQQKGLGVLSNMSWSLMRF